MVLETLMTSLQRDYLASTYLTMYFNSSAMASRFTFNRRLVATDGVHAPLEIAPGEAVFVLLKDLQKV